MTVRDLTDEELEIYLGSTIRSKVFTARFVPVVDEASNVVTINDFVISLPSTFFALDYFDRSLTLLKATVLACTPVVGKDTISKLLTSHHQLRQAEDIKVSYTSQALAPDELVIAYAGAVPNDHDLKISRELFAGDLLKDITSQTGWNNPELSFEGLALASYAGPFHEDLSTANTLWSITELVAGLNSREGKGYKIFEAVNASEGNRGRHFKWLVPMIKHTMASDIGEIRDADERAEARNGLRALIPVFQPYVIHSMPADWSRRS